MAISEATALARARAVRATFPTGTITTAQASAMVLAMADSQVGYASGSPTASLYGDGNNWRSTKGWRWDGYWCARGISWVFDQCFGADAATAGIGKQAYQPMPTGWAATWLWLDWLRKGRWVGLENAQPGDISIQSWGRTGRESDHVEIVTGTYNGTTYPAIGFNTIAGAGPVTTGATVAKVRRGRSPTVGIYRPDWAALVRTYNASAPNQEDDSMSAAEVKEIKDYIDQKFQVEVSKGTADNLHTGRTGAQPLGWFLNLIGNRIGRMDQRITALEATANTHTQQLNTVGRVAAEARELARSVPERVIAARVPFKEGTSLHRLFGKDFRFGALLGYSGATFVDRDTHTDEIVDALDNRALAVPEVASTEVTQEHTQPVQVADDDEEDDQ